MIRASLHYRATMDHNLSSTGGLLSVPRSKFRWYLQRPEPGMRSMLRLDGSCQLEQQSFTGLEMMEFPGLQLTTSTAVKLKKCKCKGEVLN